MRHSNVSNHNQGFTILEALIVVVIVGILAALAAPSFLAWNQRKQVDAAINGIEGGIKEAQRQAMSKARTCNVAFTTTLNTPKLTSDPITNTCLITGDRILTSVSTQVSTNNTSLTATGTTPISFNFNFLGKTVDNSGVDLTSNITIVVTHTQNANLKRCLVVSSPLGLIGIGKYTGTGSNISNNCNP